MIRFSGTETHFAALNLGRGLVTEAEHLHLTQAQRTPSGQNNDDVAALQQGAAVEVFSLSSSDGGHSGTAGERERNVN